MWEILEAHQESLNIIKALILRPSIEPLTLFHTFCQETARQPFSTRISETVER